MAIKTIDQSPNISDTILLNILTADANGCFSANPYIVNNVTIYYVERNFALGNPAEYDQTNYDSTLLSAAQTAAQLACQAPTPANITAAQQAQQLASSHATVNPIYYNEASAVQIIGNPTFPAWLSTDIGNAIIQNIPTDALGNPQYGYFQYAWNPSQAGAREGDYIVCWTWTMLPAGTTQSANIVFSLLGDTQATTSIPTHQTPLGKYQTLLTNYLPPMYSTAISATDQTPTVLANFNNAIAQGFTDLENLSNQIVDLLDANATAEAILPLLARLFNLKLRSSDPTRWRRQIKRAIPLFKGKGTVGALQEAFQQAGMNMTKFTRMWQVISPYTWQDQFNFDGTDTFTLSHVALPFDPNNFVLSIRHATDANYSTSNPSYVSFRTVLGITTMTWIGPALQPDDSLLILYLVNSVPDYNSQLIENYIRTLPLADQRDERMQNYPLKNWNVRIIEEDDPMFGVVVPVRHPFQDDVIFGKVRTEFAYSENTYLMDEYNGCASGDTLVITEKGVKKIQELTDDKTILTEFGFKKFCGLQYQGKRKTIAIKTKMGRSLSVTCNHKFRVLSDDGRLKWKTASSISCDDYILGKKGRSAPINRVTTCQDIYYLTGFAYGDGTLFQDVIEWLIPQGEEESKDLICGILSKNNAKFNIFLRTPEKHQLHTTFKCNKNIYKVRSSRKQIPAINHILPPHQEKGKWKSHLPNNLWNASDDEICAFLRGLFDTDGSIQRGCPVLTTKWLSLATEVQAILLALGVISSVTSYGVSYKGEIRKYFRVRVIGKDSIAIFISKINFTIKAKKKALENSYLSTNIAGNRSRIFRSDRTIIPFADIIVGGMFPQGRRIKISKLAVKDRTKEEKQTIDLIFRLRKHLLKNLPDNRVKSILAKALEYGVDNEYRKFLSDYVENSWFFDQVATIIEDGNKEVFDPLNVEETQSYISDGLVSHNSLRDSTEPCDMDKDFLDPCGQCQGSKFSIDLEIQNLSNDRLLEAQDIITEFVPFHAVLHSINFSGSVDEFIQTPLESIECLIQYTGQEEVVAGGAQLIFGRAMFGGFDVAQVKRNVLAHSTLVVNNATGTAYNDDIVIACPLVNFEEIGMNLDGLNVLEILAPSPLAGTYSLSSPQNNYAEITPISPTTSNEPVNTSPFTFRLSNDVYTNVAATITQDNVVILTDANISFTTLGVISDWNISHGHSGGPWQILIPAYSGTPYTIHQVLPNGGIILNYNNTLPSSNAQNVTYQLLTDTNVLVASGTTGDLTISLRALVDISSDILMNNLTTVTRVGQWMEDSTGVQYEISDFIASGSLVQRFHVLGWNLGNVGGRTIQIYNRLVDNQIGYLGYIGQELQAGTNLEVSLGINNGSNPPPVPLENSEFKENFLVVIGTDYYAIAAINGSLLTLTGPQYNWKTLTAGGTPVTFNVYQYIKQPYTIQGTQFDFIDRRGKEIITNDLAPAQVLGMAPPEFLFAQLNKPGNQIVEAVVQSESIKYTIEYADGTKEQGSI